MVVSNGQVPSWAVNVEFTVLICPYFSRSITSMSGLLCVL